MFSKIKFAIQKYWNIFLHQNLGNRVDVMKEIYVRKEGLILTLNHYGICGGAPARTLVQSEPLPFLFDYSDLLEKKFMN